ncbi:hypothetical protein G6688_01745 [Polynucleobacter paneuropaeus]|nr:hypothetical protein G6688_01745 [Polynucleobacter paneuropaeus]
MGIKILGIFLATLVFVRFTPLVDSYLYLQGFYTHDSELRTRLISIFAKTVSDLGGNFFAHFLFSIIAISGFLYYYYSGGKKVWFCLLLLLPSSLIWTSIVGKEAIFFGSTSLVLVIWSRYACDNFSTADGILGLLSICICILLRPHYSIALIWLLLAAWGVKQLDKKAIPFLITLLLSGVVLGYYAIWESLQRRGFEAIAPLARSSRFVSLGIDPGSMAGYLKYKTSVPLGAVYGIVGPLPSEVWQRIEFLPFFIEGLLILFAPLLIYIYALKANFKAKPLFIKLFWWSLVPAMIMLMVLHAPFGLLNPGSATRWRTNFDQVFYFAPLLLLFGLMDNDKKTNPSSSP